MTQPIDDRMDRIKKMEEEVTEAEISWNEAKAAAAECKKIFDGRVQSLREEIRRTNDHQIELDLPGAQYEVVDDRHRISEGEPAPGSMAMSENPGGAEE
jgi:hypothetical protein